MYIIPQNLKNEIKNLLKIKISSITNKYVNEIVDSVFDISNKNKYVDIVSDIEEKNRKMIVEIIKETIELVDDVFEKSIERLMYLNVCKKKVPRRIDKGINI